MSLEYPTDVLYMDSHEYIRIDGDIASIGITAFALEELGDIVFMEPYELNTKVMAGDCVATIESVKAVSEVYTPVSGVIVERNERLIEYPEYIVDDPYVEGWFLKIKMDNPGAPIKYSISAEEYKSLITF